MNITNATFKHSKPVLRNDPSDHPTYLTIITCIYIPILVLVSCYGNACLLIFTRKHNCTLRQWHPISFLIHHLVVCNLVITIVPSLSNFHETITQEWMLGPVFCNITVIGQYLFASVSHFSLLVIAMERYLAITRTYHEPSKVKLKTIMGIVWAASLGVSLAVVFVHHPNVKFKSGGDGCINSWIHLPAPNDEIEVHAFLALILFTILFIIPKIGMSVIYTKLAINLWRRKVPGIPNQISIEYRRRRNKQITAMFLVTVVLFLILWLPTWIQQFILLSNYGSQDVEHVCVVDSVVSNCAFSYYALNPWVFILFVSNFRRLFRLHRRWVIRTLIFNQGVSQK